MAEVSEQFKFTFHILSKIKQFHLDDKYWDVQLRIDNKIFKCQRSILAVNSKYFDDKFSSSSDGESDTTTDQPITLHDFDATLFEKLYSFMYEDDISICVNDFNVLPWLRMNDFLQLRRGRIKEQCLEYVKECSQKLKPMPNALALLRFTRHSKEENILNTHICSHLYHYSKDPQLVEISFENLNALLEFSKNFILPVPGSADILLMIVHNWINHDREGRSEYLSNLMEYIDFANVPSNFSRSLIMMLENALSKVVINLSKDFESLSQSKMLDMIREANLTEGDVQLNAVIKHKFEKVSEMKISAPVYSSSRTICGLSWKIGVEHHDEDNLGLYLFCSGTKYVSSPWCCYAFAKYTIVCHKEERDNFVVESSVYEYTSERSSSLGAGPVSSMRWDYLMDTKNGLRSDDDSFTLNVQVFPDVPFRKMI